MQAHRISIDAHYRAKGLDIELRRMNAVTIFRLTIERDLCDTDEINIRGIRRMVMMTTTPPIPNRIANWILL
jgi:hypothetical protein